MPQAAVDPVVMAAMIVVRLQTIVSRELAATTPAVVTVGSIHAGTGPNVIHDSAVIQLNVRTYDDASRTQVLDAIERIVKAECEGSRSPKAPEIERTASFPPTVNDEAPTRRVAEAFAAHFGDAAHTIDLQTASEDMSEIPKAFGAPFTYWGIGGIDPNLYTEAVKNGTIARDIPVNHSPAFAPVTHADPGHRRQHPDRRSPRLARRVTQAPHLPGRAPEEPGCRAGVQWSRPRPGPSRHGRPHGTLVQRFAQAPHPRRSAARSGRKHFAGCLPIPPSGPDRPL